MISTIEYYEVLLGLTSPWEVSKVNLSTEQLRVDIHITHIGESACCPECGLSCRLYDHSPERTWRHL
ncbi:MAG: hypothetical protein V3V05_08460, partial [Pontiella sp.]